MVKPATPNASVQSPSETPHVDSNYVTAQVTANNVGNNTTNSTSTTNENTTSNLSGLYNFNKIWYRGNSIFAYNGMTKVCALCATYNFNCGNFDNTNKINLSRHIDLGLCKFVDVNLSSSWDSCTKKLKCLKCFEVLCGETHTYTRLLAHALQCKKTKSKKSFTCCWPNCNKKKI